MSDAVTAANRSANPPTAFAAGNPDAVCSAVAYDCSVAAEVATLTKFPNAERSRFSEVPFWLIDTVDRLMSIAPASTTSAAPPVTPAAVIAPIRSLTVIAPVPSSVLNALPEPFR